MAEAHYPQELAYHPEHDWARLEGDEAVCGISWFAQDQLGEVIFVDMPELGARVTRGEPYAEVESIKAVSDVISPVDGTVTAVNAALNDAPDMLNDDPYGRGWLVRVRVERAVALAGLLSSAEYQALLG